ncbi:MAG: hypothetical protein RQ729_11860, partial [Wenzhouxiangellaceae bacterium]|nr:hypothetical protein [Wenzhouxiangellaceae bacterium]
YGTRLLWPLSDQRVAWNVISVIDPLFTLPILLLLGVAIWKQRPAGSLLAALWATSYLGFGLWQQAQAEALLRDWAAREGLAVERSLVKPSFANLVVWRGLIDDGAHFHAVAIRVLPGTAPTVWRGATVEHLAEVPEPGSRRARDLARFRHFSSDWLFHHADMDVGDQRFIGDFRYAIDPASARPLWGVLGDPGRPEQRLDFRRSAAMPAAERAHFFDRLFGRMPMRLHGDRPAAPIVSGSSAAAGKMSAPSDNSERP